jgi:alkylation response protein AidB-like acyl-CoA dehydrogenase
VERNGWHSGLARPDAEALMDFAFSEEQLAFQRAVAEFVAEQLSYDLVERDLNEAFSREAWRRCAAFGIQGLPVPEEYGGTAADAVTIAAALEALGYGCKDNGLVFALNAQLWAVEVPLVRFGTEEQKRRYLPGLSDGSLIAAQAMTEPGSGSDAFSLKTRAVRRDDAFVLTGSKTFVTNAPEAELLLVYASTDPASGFAGVSAFLVERGAPGLEVGPPLKKMGLRTSPMSELFLDGCEVGDGGVLGKPGSGMAVFNVAMLWERSLILAAPVGSMRRQLERCVEYAKDRRQFGQPIGSFQAVSHRIVEMKLRLETARLLLYRLAWSLDRGQTSQLDAALTKLHVSECYLQSSLDALQIFGGYGYMTEYELERDVRDAVAGRIHSGTSDMQRNIVARYLGL